MLLNRGVARRLKVGVGDTVVALGNASDGRLTAVKLNVTGIWVVPGLEAYEWGACYADIAAVQELVDVGDAAGVVIFRQKDPDADAAPIAASLERLFARRSASPPRPTPGRRWEGRSSAACCSRGSSPPSPTS